MAVTTYSNGHVFDSNPNNWMMGADAPDTAKVEQNDGIEYCHNDCGCYVVQPVSTQKYEAYSSHNVLMGTYDTLDEAIARLGTCDSSGDDIETSTTTYTITATITGGKMTYSKDGSTTTLVSANASSVTKTYEVNSGDSLSLTITPYSQEYIHSIVKDGSSVSISNRSSQTVSWSNITSNKSITVVCACKPSVSALVSSNYGTGTVSFSSLTARDGEGVSSQFEYGTSVTAIITPASGYQIKTVYVDGSLKSSMTGATSDNPQTVTFSSSDMSGPGSFSNLSAIEDGTAISSYSSSYYDHLITAEFEAIPKDTYVVQTDLWVESINGTYGYTETLDTQTITSGDTYSYSGTVSTSKYDITTYDDILNQKVGNPDSYVTVNGRNFSITKTNISSTTTIRIFLGRKTTGGTEDPTYTVKTDLYLQDSSGNWAYEKNLNTQTGIALRGTYTYSGSISTSDYNTTIYEDSLDSTSDGTIDGRSFSINQGNILEDTTFVIRLARKTTKYKITFVYNNNTGYILVQEVTAGNKISLVFPTVGYEGYTFNGWYTSANGGEKITDDTVATQDQTLYAHWTKSSIDYLVESYKAEYDGLQHSITVTFDTSNYNILYSTTNGSYTLSSLPTYTDYTNGDKYIYFKITKNDDTSISITDVATVNISQRPITITASSASKVYDGTYLTSNSASLTSGSIVSGQTATYSASGSIINVGSTTNVPSVIIRSNTIDVTNNYNITKVNGVLTITKQNNNSNSGSSSSDSSSSSSSGSSSTNTYNVTLIYNNGTDKQIEVSVAEGTYYSTIFNTHTVTYEGYNLAGWYTVSGVKIKGSAQVDEDIVLYAHWTASSSTDDSDGDDTIVYEQILQLGDSQTRVDLSLNGAVRTKKLMIPYNSSADDISTGLRDQYLVSNGNTIYWEDPVGLAYFRNGGNYLLTRNQNSGEIFNDYANNIASGALSHAEGLENEASAHGAHAEGANNEASGMHSHVEGWHSKATAEEAHAEGYYTEANGSCSHANGFYVVANGDNQTAIGRYNEARTDALFIVGNGVKPVNSSAYVRNNCFVIAETIDSNNNSTINVEIDGGILPIKTNTYTIGSSDILWKMLYTDDITTNNIHSGTIVPLATEKYNLGSTNLKWKTLYAQYIGNSIYPAYHKGKGGKYDLGANEHYWHSVYSRFVLPPKKLNKKNQHSYLGTKKNTWNRAYIKTLYTGSATSEKTKKSDYVGATLVAHWVNKEDSGTWHQQSSNGIQRTVDGEITHPWVKKSGSTKYGNKKRACITLSKGKWIITANMYYQLYYNVANQHNTAVNANVGIAIGGPKVTDIINASKHYEPVNSHSTHQYTISTTWIVTNKKAQKYCPYVRCTKPCNADGEEIKDDGLFRIRRLYIKAIKIG